MADTDIDPVDVFALMRDVHNLKGTLDIKGNMMERLSQSTRRLETAVGTAQKTVPMLDKLASLLVVNSEADSALVYLTEVRQGLWERGRDIDGVENAMLVLSVLLGLDFDSIYDEMPERTE